MKTNRVSVCMATYNGELFIERQLRSILIQLEPTDEVIVSDDHSTDRTGALIRQVNDNRVQFSLNTGNSGPLGNFENALQQATGDYILLADQDDIWMPTKVAIIRKLLQQYDLVLHDAQVIDNKGKELYPSFFKHRGSRPGFWYNLYKNSYIGCCIAFRRGVLTYSLPFPKHIHMHDWWIGLLTEKKGRVFFYPQPLMYYIRHGNNASPTGERGYGPIRKLKNRLWMFWEVSRRLLR